MRQAYEEQQAARPTAGLGATAPEQPPPQAPANDILSQLQQLGELKEAGVLTEEEFAAQKAKILGS